MGQCVMGRERMNMVNVIAFISSGLLLKDVLATRLTNLTLYPISTTWYNAKEICKQSGTQLVEVRTESTNMAVKTLWQRIRVTDPSLERDSLWIGLRKTFSGFIWVGSETSVSYTDWHYFPDGHDCVKIKIISEQWVTRPCAENNSVMCQRVTDERCDYEDVYRSVNSMGGTVEIDVKWSVTKEECIHECDGGFSSSGLECWGFQYKNSYSKCLLFHTTHPFVLDDLPEWNPGKIQIKRCLYANIADAAELKTVNCLITGTCNMDYSSTITTHVSSTITPTTVIAARDTSTSIPTTVMSSGETSTSIPTTVIIPRDSSTSITTTVMTSSETSTSIPTTVMTSSEISTGIPTTGMASRETSPSIPTTVRTTNETSITASTTVMITREASTSIPTTVMTFHETSPSIPTTVRTTNETSIGAPTTDTTTRTTSRETSTSIPTTVMTNPVSSTSILTTVMITRGTSTSIPTMGNVSVSSNTLSTSGMVSSDRSSISARDLSSVNHVTGKTSSEGDRLHGPSSFKTSDETESRSTRQQTTYPTSDLTSDIDFAVTLPTDEPVGTKGNCSCVCYIFDEAKRTAVMAEVMKLLTVNRSELSSVRRKHYCASDKRPSATGLGYGGILFMGIVFIGVFASDFIHHDSCQKSRKFYLNNASV